MDATSDSSSTHRAADAEGLRAAIERELPLAESSMLVAGQTLRWFKAADPDSLLTAAVERTDQPAVEIDPFWTVMWRAAQGIDAFLAREDIRGVRVLELGCGAGQAGIAAALRGAHVTLSDAVPIALRVAELNAYPVRDRVTCKQLRWGSDVLDDPPFPLIIGSDIVYDPNHFPQLEKAARAHLAPGGCALFSEPHRHTGDKFSAWIIEAGWSTVEHDIQLDQDRVPIRIFECRLKTT